MSESNDFHPFIEPKGIEIDIPVVGQAVPTQRRARAPGQFLPRNQIGVMFRSVVTMTSPGTTACSNRSSPSAYETRFSAPVAFFV